MKKFIFIVCLIAPTFCFSEEYSEVIEVKGKTSNQLYVAARQWFAKTFVSSNDVLQMEDAIAGKLIGKGNTSVTESLPGFGMSGPGNFTFKIGFTISVAVRDGRYKCEINDISIQKECCFADSQNISAKEPYANFLKDKAFYKNAADPDWLLTNGDIYGNKFTQSSAKETAATYGNYYALTVKTDTKINTLMLDLQTALKATEADW